MRVFLLLSLVAPITGFTWIVPDAVAQSAVPANIPNAPANITFEGNSPLNFHAIGSISDFLASGGAFNIVGSQPI